MRDSGSDRLPGLMTRRHRVMAERRRILSARSNSRRGASINCEMGR